MGLEERDREKIPFKGQQPAAYIILTHLIKKLHNLGKICRICNAKSMLVGVIQLRQIALDSMDPFDLQLTMFENRKKKSHSTLRAKRAYVYILSGQKFIKNAKNGRFSELLKT